MADMNGALKWVGTLLAAGGILVAATVYSVETRELAQTAMRQTTDLSADVSEIKSDIKEILQHLRPYR